MPIYDYLCPACGPFTELAPMASFEDDAPCPECNAAAPRALLRVPNFSRMSQFKAHAVNEKNSFAPETSGNTGRHPSGCGCCKAAKPGAMKTTTGSRPWMISH